MKLGLFNLMTFRDHPDGIRGVVDDTRTMVRDAEEIGFDIAWFAEHHFTNYSMSVSPLTTAAAMSGVTSRIRLGTGVVVLPLYHPMRVAQEIALLDIVSGGRAVLGVGTGYQRYEFERYGHPVEAKTDVFLEYWQIVEQALSEGRVTFSGKYISVPETVFNLRPIQRPMPQLFVTSVDPRILKALAPHRPTPFMTAGWRGSETLFQLAEGARASWEKAGLGGTEMPFALQQYIHVTDSPREALEAAERARYVGRLVMALRESSVTLNGTVLAEPPLPDEPPLETFRDNLLIGDAHHVAERMLHEIRRLKPIHYNCFFQFGDMPLSRARRSLDLFAKRVLPLVEGELGYKLTCETGGLSAVA
jgi:alkanesulfonate monooxygenase SsuD/methylene tetrahydromethanopterin reductase-like flavin-dependent oxidoreductase (luciferase family)